MGCASSTPTIDPSSSAPQANVIKSKSASSSSTLTLATPLSSSSASTSPIVAQVKLPPTSVEPLIEAGSASPKRANLASLRILTEPIPVSPVPAATPAPAVVADVTIIAPSPPAVPSVKTPLLVASSVPSSPLALPSIPLTPPPPRSPPRVLVSTPLLTSPIVPPTTSMTAIALTPPNDAPNDATVVVVSPSSSSGSSKLPLSTCLVTPRTLRTLPGGWSALKWLPDDVATTCGECKVKFGPLTRRHHCRACGGAYCDTCSSVRLPLAHLPRKVLHAIRLTSTELVRHCKTCALPTIFSHSPISATGGRLRIDGANFATKKGVRVIIELSSSIDLSSSSSSTFNANATASATATSPPPHAANAKPRSPKSTSSPHPIRARDITVDVDFTRISCDIPPQPPGVVFLTLRVIIENRASAPFTVTYGDMGEIKDAGGESILEGIPLSPLVSTASFDSSPSTPISPTFSASKTAPSSPSPVLFSSNGGISPPALLLSTKIAHNSTATTTGTAMSPPLPPLHHKSPPHPHTTSPPFVVSALVSHHHDPSSTSSSPNGVTAAPAATAVGSTPPPLPVGIKDRVSHRALMMNYATSKVEGESVSITTATSPTTSHQDHEHTTPSSSPPPPLSLHLTPPSVMMSNVSSPPLAIVTAAAAAAAATATPTPTPTVVRVPSPSASHVLSHHSTSSASHSPSAAAAGGSGVRSRARTSSNAGIHKGTPLSADTLALLAPLNGQWMLDEKASDDMTPLLKLMGVPWLVIKLAVAARSPIQTIDLHTRGLNVTMTGIVTHKNSYIWAAKSLHKNPDGSTYPAMLSIKMGAAAEAGECGGSNAAARAAAAAAVVVNEGGGGGVQGGQAAIGFDLVMNATGKGILTSSYRAVTGDPRKLTILIIMRHEKTGADILRIHRYLDRIEDAAAS